MKINKLICSILCAIVISSALSCCAGTGATPDEAETSGSAVTSSQPASTDTTAPSSESAAATQQMETKPVLNQSGGSSSGSGGSSSGSGGSSSGSGGSSSGSGGSSSGSGGSSSGSGGSNSGSGGSNSGSQSVNSSAKRCTITVGTKGYVADKGDTVIYRFYMKTPKPIENLQATTYYDSSMLKLKSSSSADMFPLIGRGMICNTKLDNMLKYNCSNLEGYDFTSKSVVAEIEFEVIATGGTAVSTTIEIMDEVGGASYVDNNKIIGDISYEETLTV